MKLSTPVYHTTAPFSCVFQHLLFHVVIEKSEQNTYLLNQENYQQTESNVAS
eukprot:m.501718 g.501718  ORF g.501718 m.501718 type:complete len:52 (-) comp57333_c0_seq14:1353-1508(-)